MADLKYIICGKLFNGKDDEFYEGWKILVDGNKIAAVGPELERPESAMVIDLSDSTVTPGMIDAHMHMDFWDWHTIRQEVYETSEEAKTLSCLHTAQKTLARGFTTVRHMGGITSNGFGILDVKRAIDAGHFSGSRIIAASRFICGAGSHGDLSQAFSRNPEMGMIAQKLRKSLGAGPDFMVNAVREEIKYGSDFIKIMATGGFFTPNDNPMQTQLNDEELEAVIRTAHEWGKTVTAHVYSVPHIRKLLQYRIDGMEHCALMDNETADMIADSGAYVVPTFSPYEEAIHYDPEGLKDKQPEFRAKLELYRDSLQQGRKVIKNARNIRLGFGTDFVANHMNYESGYEYKAWFESDMGVFRTLKAATSVNAGIVQMEDRIGTIEPGKLADIAAWRRDFFTDPYAMLDCAFVMKDGVVYNTESDIAKE